MKDEPIYTEQQDLSGLDNKINPNLPLAFDTETCGLYGKIRLAQFFQEGWDKVVLVHWPEPFQLAALLIDKRVVMHNRNYDESTMQRQMDSTFLIPNAEDTLYLSRLKFPREQTFSLDFVMHYVLGFDPYKQAGLNKKALQNTNWNVPVLTADQKLYAAIDVFYLLDVYEAVKDKAETTSYKLDTLCLKYALKFQRNGMPLLQDEVAKQYQKNLEQYEAMEMPINVNSYKQVRPYIGSNNSDAIGLSELALTGNDRAKAVLDARRLLKQNSFLTKWSNYGDRMYGVFQPAARSGRFTCKDDNLQQNPRKLKHCFGFDSESGKVLVYADYAQLEMRCIAAITGDYVMEKLLREGADLHNHTATMLFGKDFTDIQRQIAKTANFGLLYAAGARTYREILIKEAFILISEEEAAAYKRKWRSTFPGIAKWQDQGASDWRHGRIWQTPFGRQYVGGLLTDQLNIQNQGFGAEVAKLAMHYLEREPSFPMVNFVHDAFIYEVDDDPDVYIPFAEFLGEQMQKAWYEACRTGINLKLKDLPMPVDVFVGPNLGRIEKQYSYKYTLEGTKYAN